MRSHCGNRVRTYVYELILVGVRHSLCGDGLALFHIVMCLLLGSLIWYLLLHYCCRFHFRSLQLSQVGMGFRNWSEYNVVSFLYVAGTSCILLLVCAQSPEVYIVKGGMLEKYPE